MTIQLNARVSRTYTELSSRTLRHNDWHLVYLTLFTLLRGDTNYKITWLSVAEPALRETRRDQWQMSTRSGPMVQGMRRCMFTWLRRYIVTSLVLLFIHGSPLLDVYDFKAFSQCAGFSLVVSFVGPGVMLTLTGDNKALRTIAKTINL
jgi:hypothetical protein